MNRSVLERARPATRAELEGIPWLRVLEGADLQRAQTALRIAPAQTGDRICRFGRPPTFWFGVVDGLLKMSNDTPSGGTITYMGLPPGAWFGEGTLIKREPYRYNIEALRRSTVAGLPIEDFHALLDRSIPFNRYLMNQLNERLGHFIAAREIDRQDDPDSRVAGSLAQLFNPVLYPGVGGLLRITQQELGYLVGLSRQRVNQALNTLAAQGLIGIEYGGVRVRDLAALRALSVR
ncbi:MAG: Crp/Fnr family transcriptional regulator [Betaproteobacteria bacterium]